jgi:hypothetical protein
MLEESLWGLLDGVELIAAKCQNAGILTGD